MLQFRNSINLETGIPTRTDLDRDYREKKFVYVISHPNYPGEYKVGIAWDAQKRLVAYQKSDPERRYKIEFEVEIPHFWKLEKHVRDTFPNKREWVQADLEEIEQEIKTTRRNQNEWKEEAEQSVQIQ